MKIAQDANISSVAGSVTSSSSGISGSASVLSRTERLEPIYIKKPNQKYHYSPTKEYANRKSLCDMSMISPACTVAYKCYASALSAGRCYYSVV